MRCQLALMTVILVLAGVSGFPSRVSAGRPGPVRKPAAVSGAGERAATADTLDLNTATAGQLRQLPGMGDVYVRRILEGRPYSAKNQLLTRGILPPSAYEAIRDLIVAHRPPRER